MLGTKNCIICDRKIYPFKGKWKNANEDKETTIFYDITRPITLITDYRNGREEVKPTMEIVVFGEHQFCNRDIITLQDGTKLRIDGITPNYMEHSIYVRDILKPKVESILVSLE